MDYWDKLWFVWWVTVISFATAMAMAYSTAQFCIWLGPIVNP